MVTNVELFGTTQMKTSPSWLGTAENLPNQSVITSAEKIGITVTVFSWRPSFCNVTPSFSGCLISLSHLRFAWLNLVGQRLLWRLPSISIIYLFYFINSDRVCSSDYIQGFRVSCTVGRETQHKYCKTSYICWQKLFVRRGVLLLNTFILLQKFWKCMRSEKQ